MPAEQMDFLPRRELLTWEEMLRSVQILSKMGIEKVRLTGGEPFLRRDFMYFLSELVKIEGIRRVNLTTNGTATLPHVEQLKKLGVRSINLSLDTLDRARFHQFTRRDLLPEVMACLEAMLAAGFDLKINCVVMSGKNEEDLLPLAELAARHPVEVRFIEEMPFNGTGDRPGESQFWNWQRILSHLQTHFPKIQKLPDPPHSTAYRYRVPGHAGSLGIIAAFSRTFCGTCNRLRLTPQGLLKTCLYDDGVFNLKNLLRAGASDAEVAAAVREAVGNRARDGFEAEGRRRFGLPVSESMTTIGG